MTLVKMCTALRSTGVACVPLLEELQNNVVAFRLLSPLYHPTSYHNHFQTPIHNHFRSYFYLFYFNYLFIYVEPKYIYHIRRLFALLNKVIVLRESSITPTASNASSAPENPIECQIARCLGSYAPRLPIHSP